MVLEGTGVGREGVWVEQEALMVGEDQVCSEPGSRSGVAWAALTAPWSPQVVFATPGMLHAGQSLQIFRKWAGNEKNMVRV